MLQNYFDARIYIIARPFSLSLSFLPTLARIAHKSTTKRCNQNFESMKSTVCLLHTLVISDETMFIVDVNLFIFWDSLLVLKLNGKLRRLFWWSIVNGEEWRLYIITIPLNLTISLQHSFEQTEFGHSLNHHHKWWFIIFSQLCDTSIQHNLITILLVTNYYDSKMKFA